MIGDAPTMKEQIAALRAAKEKRDAEVEAELDGIELLELQLEEKYVGELGPRGKEFDIYSTTFGVYAFKKPEELNYQKAQNKIDGGRADEKRVAVHHLLASCLLYPTAEVFNKAMSDRPGLGGNLLVVVAKLAGAVAAERRSK